MPDQPDRLSVSAGDIVEQLFNQMRPILCHRETRVVADPLDEAQIVVVREFGEDGPVGGRWEAVGVRKMNDVFQLRLSPFRVLRADLRVRLLQCLFVSGSRMPTCSQCGVMAAFSCVPHMQRC
jgi:hypothetical protein